MANKRVDLRQKQTSHNKSVHDLRGQFIRHQLVCDYLGYVTELLFLLMQAGACEITNLSGMSYITSCLAFDWPIVTIYIRICQSD
jgi:hypothetical protein